MIISMVIKTIVNNSNILIQSPPIFVDWSKASVYYLLEIIISQYRV